MKLAWSEEHQNFYDGLYDPEARELQRRFNSGQPRTGEAAEELVRMWSCGITDHGECWSTGHLSTREVGLEANKHTENCSCWRHTVLAWARNRKITA
jgi:hypothetical protein